jgi:hypothetical protein
VKKLEEALLLVMGLVSTGSGAAQKVRLKSEEPKANLEYPIYDFVESRREHFTFVARDHHCDAFDEPPLSKADRSTWPFLKHVGSHFKKASDTELQAHCQTDGYVRDDYSSDKFRLECQMSDVIVVMDNSGSMSEIQGQVAETAEKFLQEIGKEGADVRLGITVTDAYTRSSKDPLFFKQFTKLTEIEEIREALKPGTDGGGTERGLGSLKEVLKIHRGFLRPNACLVILLVGDEDEIDESSTVEATIAELKKLKSDPHQLIRFAKLGSREKDVLHRAAVESLKGMYLNMGSGYAKDVEKIGKAFRYGDQSVQLRLKFGASLFWKGLEGKMSDPKIAQEIPLADDPHHIREVLKIITVDGPFKKGENIRLEYFTRDMSPIPSITDTEKIWKNLRGHRVRDHGEEKVFQIK